MAEKKTVKETVIREIVEKPPTRAKKKTPKKKTTSKKKTTKKNSYKKKITQRKSPQKTIIPKKIEVQLENNVEKILVENFVSLQKVMTNLSLKFDNLAGQISKLLELFELSAKSLAEKDFELEKNNKDNKKIMEKIEGILDQNKTLARGLTLLNEKMDETMMSQDIVEPLPPIASLPPRPLPPMPPRTMTPSQAFQEAMGAPSLKPIPAPQIRKPIIKHDNGEEYKKSISSKTQEKQ